jgi:hypothetical protein
MRRHGILAAALLSCAIGSVAAYVVTGHRWPANTSVPLQLQLGASSGALIDGSPDWDAVAERATALWNPFVGSGVSLRPARGSAAPPALWNNANDVTWGYDILGESFGEAIAVTVWLYRVADNSMVEADVIFNRAWNWDAYRGPRRSLPDGLPLLDLRRVATHEFGHVLGLAHADEAGQAPVALMNSRLSELDDVQVDDVNGMQAVYGTVIRDRLLSGGRLIPGLALVSGNGRYRLAYQADGNLVLYDDADRSAAWTTATAGAMPRQLVMQADGNLVLSDGQERVQWSTGTAGNHGAYLVVQSDGNIVVYRADGTPVWDRFSAG